MNMLDPFIIDEILKRERQQKEDVDQPQIQLELPFVYEEPPSENDNEVNRGVAIIEF